MKTACFAAFLLITAVSFADGLVLPGIFSDNMILQQKQTVPIWGKAAAGTEVAATFGKQTVSTTTDANGAWKLALAPLEASAESATLTVTAGEETKTIQNVLVGEVWHCAGQSNMAMNVKDSKDADEEAAAANYPLIRCFSVSNQPCHPATDEIRGSWVLCSAESVPHMTAVGYFFGRELHKHLNVPIGLVKTAWGGTPAEAWTSREYLERDPVLKPVLDRYDAALKEYPAKKEAYEKTLEPWKKLSKRSQKTTDWKDPGDTGKSATWADPAFDDSAWQKVPGGIVKAWAGPSVVWLRYTTDLPTDWSGKDLILEGMYCAATIIGSETLYINGEKVLTHPTTEYRRVSHTIPGRFVKGGRTVIAFRVFSDRERGQIALFKVGPKGGTPTVLRGIKGKWCAAATGADVPVEVLSQPGGAPMGPGNPTSPAGLYNGRISPIAPYALRGAIWYQGESNAGRAEQYRTLLPAMIRNWREIWQQGDFPFLIVQLAAYQAPAKNPGPAPWAELREAQAMAAEDVPNAGLVVTTDIGDAVDVHPKNKQDVGRRLALAARKIAYGEDLVYSGPIYDSMAVEGSTVRIRYKHVGGGLVAKDGAPLGHFAVAGADKTFHWATARIDGDTVLVSSDAVPTPVAVRYAWATNPEGANLYNREGLPAAPFRTDDWPGTTDGKR